MGGKAIMCRTRSGGKGASGRNRNKHDRIEEHGIGAAVARRLAADLLDAHREHLPQPHGGALPEAGAAGEGLTYDFDSLVVAADSSVSRSASMAK